MPVLSVVVNDLDVFGSCLSPAEADPPLLIDTNAVGTRAIAFQLLKPVARWNSQVTNSIGGVENEELSEGRPLRAFVELSHLLSLPYSFSVLVAK